MNTSILVVDDDDAHRGMLRMMLQAWGYSVDEAADGDLAVEAVRAKPYDVVDSADHTLGKYGRQL